MRRGLLLRHIRVDPALGGERVERLAFLSRGPVEIELRSPLTLLIGENGSGKTTLLEAVAANCAIRPGGGRSYAETEDEREDTAISVAVEVTFSGRQPKGLFLRVLSVEVGLGNRTSQTGDRLVKCAINGAEKSASKDYRVAVLFNP